MAKVERTLVASGACFDIECAVRTDLTSPVAEFLEGMRSGTLGAQDGVAYEADEQLEWRDWFLAACRHIARKGRPPHRDAHNQLQDGIWELKHWDLRVSFYDTDGSGTYEPTVDHASYGRLVTRPWPDNFEEFLRLTTTFPKTGQKTPPEEIALAIQVREEDLAHDRTT